MHPKIVKLLEQRAEMGHGKRPVDYGFAEALAFGSLLLEGTPVRLTGKIRSAAPSTSATPFWSIPKRKHEYAARASFSRVETRFCEIYNSSLSEAACLGFEYGFSRDYPEALVLWEAQFGDFVNGAQVIIDQFISAGEDKWDLPSGVVLLLPHGYEGQGPEHSSARIERFLQLAGEDNIQICQPQHRRAIFSSAAPPGPPPVAQAADCLHAQKHAASSRRRSHRGLQRTAILNSWFPIAMYTTPSAS